MHRCPPLRKTPLALLVCVAAVAVVRAQIPAFPGAAGYGGYATGGRGGDVYHVTNLNNSGAGSFADAIATVPASGRTIVFDVSGYIHLPSNSNLRLTKNKVTIAGQTAPGDGISFKDGAFLVSSDDVVVRHVRLRVGEQNGGGDCLNLDSKSINTIFDHVSMQFSTDENMSSYSSPPENLTLQWSLNAWGLESHSCGGLWDQNHATAHHTLWAHNHTRNPKARPGGLLEWVNNVTFDWDIGFIMGDSETPASWRANVRGNYFICPPGNTRSVALEKANLDRNGAPNFTIYVDNNLFDKNGNTMLDGSDYGYGIASGDYLTSLTPIANTGSAPFTIESPQLAYKKIVSSAGALRLDASAGIPLRDEVDTLLVGNLVALRRNHISSESQTGLSNGGLGMLNSTPPPADTDRDGMPDYWEQALGFNAGADDHNTVFASSGGFISGSTFFPPNTPAGYTYLEEYLHFKASPHAVVAKNTSSGASAIDVDLSRYTSGFSASPVFTIANVSGGSVTQSGAGGVLVHFVPTVNYFGRARFDFSVIDAAGDQWTQTFYLCVSAAGVPRDIVWLGGSASNAWDSATNNWLKGGTTTAFTIGDNTLFSDLGSNSPAINITGSVAPGAVTVDASKNYVFSGTGSIGSSGALTKRGTGTLTLSNTGANGFGSVELDAGGLTISNATAAGTSTMSLNGGTLNANASFNNPLQVNGPVALNVSGTQSLGGAWTGAGTVTTTITGTSTLSLTGNTTNFAGRIDVGASSGYLRLNGSLGSPSAKFDLGTGTVDLLNRNGNATFAIGALEGGSNTRLSGASAANTPSTYSIGATGNSTVFAGTIANGGGGAAAITSINKVGPGSLTLSGANTYSGATTVSAGQLLVVGSLGNTAVTIANGALFGANTVSGGVTASPGGIVSPGAVLFTAATMNVGGGLALDNATLAMDMSNSPTGANDRIVMSGGTLAMTGAIHLQFNLLNGPLTAGTYELVSGATNSTANSVTFTHNFPAGTRQTYAVSRAAAGANPSYIRLSIANEVASLTWTGANGGVWDLNITANNWIGGPTTTFFNLDSVSFTDSSSVGTVNIAGSLAPNQTTVTNAATAYTFTGAGALAGAGSLVKSGTGTLTINNSTANTFSGGTLLDGGILSIPSTAVSPLGSGTLTLAGGTLNLTSATLTNPVKVSGPSAITSTGNVTIVGNISNTLTSVGNPVLNLSGVGSILTINGDMRKFTGTLAMGTSNGMLRLNGAANANFGSAGTHFDLGTGSATLANRNGDIEIDLGAVSGGSSTTLQGRQSGSGPTATTYHVGELNTDASFAGLIKTGGDLGGVHIVKVGGGSWTLTGSSNYSGTLAAQQGRLIVAGPLTCSGTTLVQSGATLQLVNATLTTDALNVSPGGQVTGAGTIAGDLNNAGTINCSGSLSVTGDVVNNGTLCVTGGAVLNASGAFVNNGTLDLLTGAQTLPANLVNNGVIIDSSTLSQVQAAKNGSVVTITAKGYIGHNYQLQQSNSLTSPSWANIGNSQTPTSNHQILTFTDPAPTGLQRFYRIAVSP